MRDSPVVQRLALMALVSAVAGILVAGLLVPVVGGVGLLAKAGANTFENLPTDLKIPPLPQRSRVLAADGSLLATFYDEDRVAVPLSAVPVTMRKAIVAIEDNRFYTHHGIDLKGIIRAALHNTSTGSVTQGASTLTQQYVRLVLEESKNKEEQRAAHAPTLARKLREAAYAIGLEKQLTKDQILSDYLNIAYFGDGAYGVEAASRHYFGIHVGGLSLPEAALLAGLVQNPSAYDPRLHPAAAKDRRDVVLDQMLRYGDITAQQASVAKATPIILHVRTAANGCISSSAPYFCDYVEDAIYDGDIPALGSGSAAVDLLKSGGFTISTTLQPKVQRAANAALRAHVPWNGRWGAAEAVVQPGSGKIQALAVNAPYGTNRKKKQNTVDWAADYHHGGSTGFPSGSTFKVFTLAAALKQNIPLSTQIYSPGTLLDGDPRLDGYTDCAGNVRSYGGSVHNSDPAEAGDYDIARGTWDSVNTFYVQLEKKTGLCEPWKIATAMGVRQYKGGRLHQDFPSDVLGSESVYPLQMAAAYATFGAQGKYCKPFAIAKIVDAKGNRVPVPGPQCSQVLDPDVANTATAILEGVLDKPGATAYGLGIGRPAAGKTGTVTDFKAAWFCGFTPDMASAVWVGDPKDPAHHPLTGVTIGGHYYSEVFGATIAAPIWQQTLEAGLRGVPAHDFPPPSQVIEPVPPKKKHPKKPSPSPSTTSSATSPSTAPTHAPQASPPPPPAAHPRPPHGKPTKPGHG